jgi:WD40 repeat protein
MIRTLRFAPLAGLLTMTAACTGVTLGSGAASHGCGPGGANDNQHVVGDQPGGVQLALGEIAVAPDGSYVIFQGDDRLSVGWPALGVVEDLPVTKPTRLAFSKKREVIYVGSTQDGKLHALDVKTKMELWATPLGSNAMVDIRIESSSDDTRLIAAGPSHLSLLDAATGKSLAEQDLDQPLVDLALLPDGARALVVTHEVWSSDAVPLPTSKVTVLALSDGKTRGFDVPNCASTLAITPDGARAFLSPTLCNKDPISLLDLTQDTEGWVKNLPGFGPLAMAKDGATAIAFLDTHNLDATLFADPDQIPAHGDKDPEYYIMTLDTKSLAFELTVVGDTLPRYALTPDGDVLLVDSALDAATPLRLFDTKTHAFRAVTGPQVRLDNFVIASDARHVYAIELASSLFDIDVQASLASPIELPFLPTNLNIAPDDKTLYLRSSSLDICVFSLKTRECTATFSGATVTTN